MKTLQFVLLIVLLLLVIACGGAGSPYGPGVTNAGGNGGGNGGNNGGGNGGGGALNQLGAQISPMRIDDSGRMVANDSSGIPFFYQNGVKSPIPTPPNGRPPVFVDMNFQGTVLVTTEPVGESDRQNYLLKNGAYVELATSAADPLPRYIAENDSVVGSKGVIWNTPTQLGSYTAPADFQPLAMNSSGTIVGYVWPNQFVQYNAHYWKIENGVATDMNVLVGSDYLFPTVGALINDAGTIALKTSNETRVFPAGGGTMQIAPAQPRGRMTNAGVFAGQDGFVQVLTTGTLTEGRSMAFVYSSVLGASGQIRKNFTVDPVASFFGSACINNNGLLAGTYRPLGSGTPTYGFTTMVTAAFFAGIEVVVNLGAGPANTQAAGQIQFNALVSGTPNQQVTYSVDESNGGTITSTGFYRAPKVAGMYHVRAVSVANTNASAVREVVVESLGGEGQSLFGSPTLLDGPSSGFEVTHVSLDGTIAGYATGTNTEALYWNGFTGTAFPLKRTGYVAAKATGTANGKIVGIATLLLNGDRIDLIVCWPDALSEPVRLKAPSGYVGFATAPSINANGEIVSNELYFSNYLATGAILDGLDGSVANISKISNRSSIVVLGKPGYLLETPTSTAVQLTTGSFGNIQGFDEAGDNIVGVEGNLVPPTPVQFKRDGGFVRANLAMPSFVEYAYPQMYYFGVGYIAGQAGYTDGSTGIPIWNGSSFKDLRAASAVSGDWTFISVVGVGDDGDLLIKAKQGTGAVKIYYCRSSG